MFARGAILLRKSRFAVDRFSRFQKKSSAAKQLSSLESAAEEWICWDTNEETRQEIKLLLEAYTRDGHDEVARSRLTRAMRDKLVFGTAGLRGKMGSGYDCMNELTVLQATDGLCSYLLNKYGEEEAKRRGIVIGYDHRRRGTLSSDRFALLAAALAVDRGVRVHLYSEKVATPLVPYAVVRCGAAAGIMVTASHNPGPDNGYKVYWENGAQIIPPHDIGIAKCIDESRMTWSESRSHAVSDLARDVAELYTSPLCEDPYSETVDAYCKDQVKAFCRHGDYNRSAARSESDDVSIVYTAMHGVGLPYVQKTFAGFGLPNPVVVDEQALPDPDFPTVAFPNPEEGADSLNLAFETARKNGCTVILANDPDADRLAVAERVENDDESPWRVFTGNEIGTLLGHWEWSKWREANPNSDPSRAVMLASAVSSTHLGMISEVEGFGFEQTLTGFKWMGNRAQELERSDDRDVLFAFEEAIGFCVGPNTFVRDKDGVTAAAVFAEMYLQLRERGLTVSEHLKQLGERYGHCLNRSDYVICEDAITISRIFDRLRDGGNYWETCGPLSISGVRDLTTGYDSATPDNKTLLPASASSQMITYSFDGGKSQATLRTSGTEPKIKCYVEVRGRRDGDIKSNDGVESYEDLRSYCNDVFDAVQSEMLEPEKNGLRRSGDGP